MKTFAIMLARGGSKAIPKKNIMSINGTPLIEWSIKQALNSSVIEDVYVSSDDNEILECAKDCGAVPLVRSPELSCDQSSSEDGWLDALNRIKQTHKLKGSFFALQATSPIRHHEDFDKSYLTFRRNGLDSLFSAEVIRDHHIWEYIDDRLEPSNFIYEERGMRQNLKVKYLENGSPYILNTQKFIQHKIRHFEKIGVYEMPKYKSIQIDEYDDALIAEALMTKFGNSHDYN